MEMCSKCRLVAEVKARGITRERVLKYLFFLGWGVVSAGLLFLLKALGAEGVLSMFYKSLDDGLKLQ